MIGMETADEEALQFMNKGYGKKDILVQCGRLEQAGISYKFSIWSKYNIRYGEESYRLGFEDGVQLATEREIRAKGSVLDVQDMAHLVSVHDAIND